MYNRTYQLSYCKRCSNKSFDKSQGIVCGLTGNKADFDETCSHFDELPVEKQEKDQLLSSFDRLKLHKATGLQRFTNYLIDSVAVLILLFWFAALISTFFYRINFESRLTVLLFNYIVVIFYYTFFEGIFGRTPGKMITGTKVINKNGEAPGFILAFLRSCSRIVPFEAFSFFGEETEGWHDKWTDTIVVSKKSLNNQKY